MVWFLNYYYKERIKMTIYIKNMVCVRCKMAVQSVLQELAINYETIELGRVTLAAALSSQQLIKLNNALKKYELELMEDKKKILVERIKTLIIKMFHTKENEVSIKFSEFVSKALNYDYTYLANTFSEVEGSTIERFYITSRIERAKELMVYEDVSLKEIAFQLNYSSMAHFCMQFKKVTGHTPTDFKKLCDSQGYVWRNCE